MARLYHRARRTAVQLVGLALFGSLIVLALSGLVFRALAFRQTHAWGDLAAAAFCLVFSVVWIAALAGGIRDAFVARVVPYFERRVGLGASSPFRGGAALGRDRERLDQLALRAGVEPLSSFGYADDRLGETLQWHDAEAGLRTVRALAEASNSASVTRDLAAIEHALGRAAEQGIRFCLILRRGRDRFISPPEMDSRRGWFW